MAIALSLHMVKGSCGSCCHHPVSPRDLVHLLGL